MRIISSLSLTIAALICALACERANSPLTPSGPTVTPGVVSLSIIGERQLMVTQTVTLRAVAEMSDGSMRDVSRDAMWLSSNTVVCSAGAGGVIAADSAGICDISATFGSITTNASFSVVVDAWTGEIISFEVIGPRTLTAGQGDRYIVMANMPDGSQTDITARATFSSSNPTAAEIDRDGRVVAHAGGSTTITVTAAGLEDAFRVTILPSP